MSDHATPKLEAYWKTNLRIITLLLTIWFLVSHVCGVLLVNQLDTIKLGGFPLGFWFANQGSMIVFVLLIWVYVWWMDKLDIQYEVDES